MENQEIKSGSTVPVLHKKKYSIEEYLKRIDQEAKNIEEEKRLRLEENQTKR